MRDWLADFFVNSPLRELSGQLMRTVPGLPPILQTIHLLGLAVLMGSIVMICLRLLNVAARRQDAGELMGRLFPWFVWSLPVMLFSALPFFLARPQRYIYNPVFAIKMAALATALGLSFWLWQRFRHAGSEMQNWLTRGLAIACLAAWLTTAMGGRWIAYADYLFWPG
tara:strand:+ start:1337 stop:1840 length:504 start_codon:yes stop_codon:yes gene_type:complete